MASHASDSTPAQPVTTEVHLERREGDDLIDANELRCFEFFRGMGKVYSVLKEPGSIVLRRYRAGEVLFQQGDSGIATAFYIPTEDDLRRYDAGDPAAESPGPAAPKSQKLTALILSSETPARPRGLWQRLFGGGQRATAEAPAAIPQDGPSDIDYATRQAPLMEGDLFGEMSCISFLPRSATVVAKVDCRVLEFTRSVMDAIKDDPKCRERVDETYRQRTLDTHLRRLNLFRGLTEPQLALLKSKVALETVPAGTILCEEGELWSDEKPLDVFIVRNGVVQVTANTQLSLRSKDILDWGKLCRMIVESQPDPKPAPAATAPAKELSPLEKVKAAQAAKATGSTPAEAAKPPGDAATPTAAPPKLSPLEIMRAKQAAKSGEAAAPKAPEAEATSPKPLSPIEQMRAKQTAAAESTAKESPPVKDATPAAPKLSPIEQMRAKQAAVKEPADTETTPAKDAPPATPKLSPIELMRAKKAAAETAAPTSPARSLSPLEMMKAKAAEKAGAAASSPVEPAEKQEESLLRSAGSKDSGPPAFIIKSWLSDRVLAAVAALSEGNVTEKEQTQSLLLAALNKLMRHAPFLNNSRMVADVLSTPQIARATAAFPNGLKGIGKNWSEWELCTAGRAALNAIFAGAISTPAYELGPPRTLAYLSRGDCIGEIAVVNTKQPRTATCIAYTHPSAEDRKEFGEVELVRIPGKVFRQLMDESKELKDRVTAIAEARATQTQTVVKSAVDDRLIGSPEFQRMGLFQGQQLLVIDLDRCTRCGDCVEACVNTHDDGYSRLFLDGPRYDRFLVPSACRNCLNPVCMIGCPVGSISRADNGQIEIHDWCIGCGKCASNCPYDSIQMHDVGVITEKSPGWESAPRKALAEGWQNSRRAREAWLPLETPLQWSGEFLRKWGPASPSWSESSPAHFCFRHSFQAAKSDRFERYRLKIQTDAVVAGVWLNGKPIEWSGKSVDLEAQSLSSGQNLLAVEIKVSKPPDYGKTIFSVRLDALSEAGVTTLEVLGTQTAAELKLIQERAVVCDLCSHIPSQKPACVSSCPHDAAFRFDPLNAPERLLT